MQAKTRERRPVRRLLVGAALAVALLTVAACGDDSADQATSSAAPPAEAKAKRIAYVGFGQGDEFSLSIGCGARAEAEKLGVEFEAQEPTDPDASHQTPVLNAVVAKKPDAIIMGPTDVAAMVAPAKAAAAAGIKIVLVDNALKDSSFASSVVATDNVAGGRVAADAMAKLIGGEGKVFTEDLKAGIPSTDARRAGFAEGAKALGLEYVGFEFTGFESAKAASVTAATLAREPDLLGIFATHTFAGEGAAVGLRQANKQGKVKVIAFDASPAQQKALEQGDLQALVSQKPDEIGRLAMQQAVAAVTEKPTQEKVATDVVVATKDNMNDPEVSKHLYQSSC